MKVVGIVSEYNPFHNGHKYHLDLSKKICSAEYAVAVMSGNFLQRGEPAIFDKWSRAKMAVLGGIDLVIELPVVYSCQTAEIFAFGAIKILNSLGIIDCLCFGSENGDVEKLSEIAVVLMNEPKEIRHKIKDSMARGMTYSKAVGEAYKAAYGDLLSYPNNVLGIEYIKSLICLNSSIKPVTVKRIRNNYNDTAFTGTISSATAIREELRASGLTDPIRSSTPEYSYNIMQQNLDYGKGPVFWEDFSNILLYELRKSNLEYIKTLPEIKEGIEYRLKKAGRSSMDFENIISALKTKRYTRTSLQRTLCHMLLTIKKEDVSYAKLSEAPIYIRVLAFNKKGRELLKEIKKISIYPIIIKAADFMPQSQHLERMFSLDMMATDIYSLAYKNKSCKEAGEDYKTSPLYIEES
ncbi:nucleotidyltransferase [Lutispora sp.]|nr:nucleotidyltransferase [Lutispora sp.]MEA4960124.1 nucleotidyltransferase [Lutispora sp.]